MPQSLEDSFTRHQIYLGRYAGSLYKEALPELKKMRDEISAKLLSTSSNTFESARLEYLLRDIKIIIDTTINGAINPKLFEDLVLYEQEFSLKVLDGATPSSVVISGGINASVLLPEVMSSTMQLQGVKGKQTIEDVIKTFSDAQYKDIESEIRRGIAEGLTTDDIVKKIQYISNNRTRQQAEAVVRTLTNHIATTARSETFREYDHLFIGEKFLSVLDSQTTLQCGVRDGGIWSFDGKPINAIAKANLYRRPALHYNCRSILVPQLKPEYDLNIDSTRSSQFGQISDKLTYSDWLKKQSASFQDDVLGKSRGKLFRDGGLTLEKFVDRKGSVLTLDELRGKEGVAKVVVPKVTIPNIKFGYDGKFDGYIADIRDEAKIVIDKLPKPKEMLLVGKNESYYEPYKNKLSVEKSDAYFVHEYGHHIDTMIGKSTNNLFYSQSESFRQARKKDIEINELDKTTGKQKAIKNLIKDGFTESEFRKTKYYDAQSDDFNMISDIYDSLTKGYFESKNLAGHGKKYFKEDMYRDLENFGNLFALYSRKTEWARTKELFPNMTNDFEKIIKEVIDGKFN